jgi:hypothetical protein
MAFIVAIIVLGLTYAISTLVMFRYGLSDNQSLPPSTAATKTFAAGTLIAFAIAIAASDWLQLESSGQRHREPLAQPAPAHSPEPETNIKTRADRRSGGDAPSVNR